MKSSTAALPTYFYLPSELWRNDMPVNADREWIEFRQAIYCWTLQTYLRLKAAGFHCELVEELPLRGMIVAHWDNLAPHLEPNDEQFFVCIQADRPRHAYAQMHIVQNPAGMGGNLLGDRYLLAGPNAYVPLWPQPHLTPRAPWRGERFEQIAYFGSEANIAPELRTDTWRQQVETLGLSWSRINDFDRWSDYSSIDAVVAIRSFQGSGYEWKPPSKLINAWAAGVPALLGRETAFQSLRRSHLDYIEVSSPAALLSSLKLLQKSPQRRRAMVHNGRRRFAEVQPAALTRQWIRILGTVALPAYQQWCRSALLRREFRWRRRTAVNTQDRRRQLQQWRKRPGSHGRLASRQLS